MINQFAKSFLATNGTCISNDMWNDVFIRQLQVVCVTTVCGRAQPPWQFVILITPIPVDLLLYPTDVVPILLFSLNISCPYTFQVNKLHNHTHSPIKMFMHFAPLPVSHPHKKYHIKSLKIFLTCFQDGGS